MDVNPPSHLKRDIPEIGGSEAGFIALIVVLVLVIVVACTAVFFLLRDEARHKAQANSRGWYSKISSALGSGRSERTQADPSQSRSTTNRKKQGWTQVGQDPEAGQDPPFVPPIMMNQRQTSVMSSSTTTSHPANAPLRTSLRSPTANSFSTTSTHMPLGGTHARQPSIGMVIPNRYNSYNSYTDTHSFYSTAPIHSTPAPGTAAAQGSSLDMDTSMEPRVYHSPAAISVAASTSSFGVVSSSGSGVGVGVGVPAAAASDGRRLLLASSSAPIFIPDARSALPTAHSPPASPSPSDFDAASTSLGHGSSVAGGAFNFGQPRIASPEPIVVGRDGDDDGGESGHPARSLSVTSGSAASEFPTHSGPMVRPRGGSKFIEGL